MHINLVVYKGLLNFGYSENRASAIMPEDSETPVILLASANTDLDRRRIKLLDQERRMITGIFQKEGLTDFQIIQESPDSGTYFFDQFNKLAFDPNVQILHIAGFAQEEGLNFRAGYGEDTVKPENLGDFLGRLPNLQLVFLNGCATPELRDQLLMRDIPALMLTDVQLGGRRYSQEIAHAFYTGIARGLSIKEAYKRVQMDYANHFTYKRVFYDLDQDKMDWSRAVKSENKLEWGLYVLEDNEKHLDWHLPIKRLQAPASSMPRPEHNHQIKLIGSGILVSALVILSLILLEVPQKLKALGQNYDECTFPRSRDTYNILQLPFRESGDCNQNDPYYEDAIERRLELLTNNDIRPGTDYQVKFLKEVACPTPFELAESMIRSCNANMVLWGDYDLITESTIKLTFKYLYTCRPHTVNQGEMSVDMPVSTFNGENDFMNSAVEDVVFWARGMGHYERREYSKAVDYFSQIRVQDTEDYLLIDSRLAKSYTFLKDYVKAKTHYNHILKVDPENYMAYNERGYIHARLKSFDEALLDFNDAIRISPEYADAYYNRGVLNYELGNYSDAIEDMQHVLDLKPDGPSEARPYGVLAAIYAEQEEVELFYSNLELALQNGLKVENHMYYYSAFRPFRNSPEFRALVSKYQ